MNEIIRESANKNGVKLWELAEMFGLSDCNFSRKLRHEFSLEETERALLYIEEIAAKKKGGKA